MTLNITVLPASTQAGRETIKALLNHEEQPVVRGIYRDTSKVPSEVSSNVRFTAVEGDVSNEQSLDFSGSDAVYYVPPPTYSGEDSRAFARRSATNIKAALQRAPSVRRLVLFSAIGARHDKDIGILVMNHIADEILKDSVPKVVITRAGYFMENWAPALQTVKSDSPFFESEFTPLDYKSPMISVLDIGEICAQKLLETGGPLSSHPSVYELHGPRSYDTNDVKNALEALTQKTVKIVPIEPDQLLNLYSGKVPEPYVQEIVQMMKAILPGGVIARDLENPENVIRGKLELVDSFRKLVSGETTKEASGAF